MGKPGSPADRPRAGRGAAALGAGGAQGAEPRSRLLLLCDYEPASAATILEHIEAIRTGSASDVYVLPMRRDLPDELDLEAFDGLVIHYSLVMALPTYLSPLARWRIARFRGVKAAFIQDEYRFVDDTVHAMRTMGINVVFTCVPEAEVDKVYPRASIPSLRRTRTVLTGYVPDELLARSIPGYDERPIDVAYRARRLPAWLGRFGQEKAAIADRFAADAPAFGLRTDISCREQDRLYGERWIEFVSSTKAMLGVESGASVFDFDGSIEAAIRAWTTEHPNASFDEIHDRFLRDVDGRIRLNQISPRCFEAAVLGTLMILYPGDYSGILQPGRHYVPLRKDHSNMAEVVATLRDRAAWERITTAAREEIALNPAWSFRTVGPLVDEALDLPLVATRGLDLRQFGTLAERSLTVAAEFHLARDHSLAARFHRIRRRAARALTPSPGAIVAAALSDARPRARLRRRVQALRSGAWWLLRPRTLLPTAWLRRPALLRELGRLSLLQEMGRRARAAGATTPFLIVADRAAGELRVELVSADGPPADLPPDPPGLALLAADLAWVSTVRLRLDDPFLVPQGINDPHARLPELTRLAASDPAAFRRVLAGPAGWYTVP